MMRGLLKLYNSPHSCKRPSQALFFVTRASFSSSASLHSVLNVLSSPKCDGATTIENIGFQHPWSLIQHRGVKVNAIHLRPGNVIEKSGYVLDVVEVEHRQRGRGGAMMQIELRDVDSGTKQNSRFGTEESVESMVLHLLVFIFLLVQYCSFMLLSPVNFEQLEVPLELFGKAAAYLKEDLKVKLQLYDDRPLSGSVPKQVTCSIKETLIHSFACRYVKAVLDNGLTVQVSTLWFHMLFNVKL
ncbi:unnamed protein product [Linum tenue]|uniref:Translation elongation factor P/YeiP central domain-containing protein n=1 Tax=Linum tenue TaxID=586396 RepID=A0AAV0M2G1_9ROSI|nr:unnamed protein product [Linum tenue]